MIPNRTSSNTDTVPQRYSSVIVPVCGGRAPPTPATGATSTTATLGWPARASVAQRQPAHPPLAHGAMICRAQSERGRGTSDDCSVPHDTWPETIVSFPFVVVSQHGVDSTSSAGLSLAAARAEELQCQGIRGGVCQLLTLLTLSRLMTVDTYSMHLGCACRFLPSVTLGKSLTAGPSY